MTWANGLPTILCEDCGHELAPELVTWYQGEVAVCRDADGCHKRREKLEDKLGAKMPESVIHRDTFPAIMIDDRNPNKDQDKARQIVLDYYNANYLPVGEELHISQIRISSFHKDLQNWKAHLSTDVPNDGMFFEVTHNGDKGETYLDAYVKAANVVIPF